MHMADSMLRINGILSSALEPPADIRQMRRSRCSGLVLGLSLLRYAPARNTYCGIVAESLRVLLVHRYSPESYF